MDASFDASGLRECSFADAIRAVAQARDLTSAQRSHWSCSLRMIAAALDRPVELVPARWTAIRQAIARLHHVPLDVTAKTLANHKSNVRSTLNWFRQEEDLPKRGEPLRSEWAELRQAINHFRTRANLSSLMRYCSAREVRPEEVDERVLDACLAYRAATTTLRSDAAARRRIARAWNSCLGVVDGWIAATKTMIERTEARFAIKPKRLAADTAYGTGAFLGWLVKEKRIMPHIPVWDRSLRDDGTFSRADFAFDKARNVYTCPAGKTLTTTGSISTDHAIRYNAVLGDCRTCALKARCCPNMPARRIVRDIHEDARDVARRKMTTKAFARSRDERKRVEMRFAHLKTHHRFERLRLRGLSGARDEFHLAAIVQNLKTMALRLLRPPSLVPTCA